MSSKLTDIEEMYSHEENQKSYEVGDDSDET